MAKKYTLAELKRMKESSSEDEDKIYELAKTLGIPGAASMDNTMLFNAVVALLTQRGELVENDDETDDMDDEDESDEKEEEVPQTVFVSYAPYSDDLKVVGLTAREIIQKLQRPWSIENDPRVYRNGIQLNDDEIMTVRMEAGDRLELAKKSSEKGWENRS